MLLVWGHIKDHIAAKFFSRCFVSFSLDLSAKRQPQRIKRRVDMTAVAPTVARMLEITEPAASEGEVLPEIIDL